MTLKSPNRFDYMATSQENVEIVLQALLATSDGDPDAGQPFFHPSMKWDVSGMLEWPERSDYRGDEGSEFLRVWIDSWQDWGFDVMEVRNVAGDRVFAEVREWAIGIESDVGVDRYRYLIFTLRSGRITRVKMFKDRAEALEAAGLPA